MADNKRYRTFNLLLYPDCKEHETAIERLISGEFNAVGILHDCDTTSEGELKKEHYHFIVKFKNNRTKSAVAKDLRIEERFIDTTVSFNASGKYLLHIGHDDKHQYDVDDLVGVLAPAVVKLLDDTTEDMKVAAICDLLDTFDCKVSYSDFVRICAMKGLYASLRRGGNLFIKIIEEHNLKYSVVQ